MKYFAILILTVIAFTNNTYQAHAEEIIDRIVVQVNEDVITLSELNEKGAPLFQEIMANSTIDSREIELQNARIKVLDQIIDQLLISQEAERYGISIAEADIDDAINSILSQNNITMDKFEKEVARIGTTVEGYRQTIRDQMLKSRVINIAVRSKILITDQQIKEYYDTYYSPKVDIPEGYHLLQIGFQWGDDKKLATIHDAKLLAEKVSAELTAGGDFSSLARTYSQLPSGENGGDIGTFKENEMAPYMLNAIKNMHPGEISDIINTPSGLQIFKLLSLKRDGVTEQPPLESVTNETQDIIYNQEMKQGYNKWLATLHENAYIKKNL